MKSIALALSIATFVLGAGVSSAGEAQKAPQSSPPAAAPAKPAGIPAAEMAKRVLAATELLKTMNTEKVMLGALDQKVTVHLQQNPTLTPHKDAVRKFFAKHLAWVAVKDEVTKLYATEFTEAELKELTAFYKTPLGIKVMDKTPLLVALVSQIEAQRIEKNRTELEKAIKDEAKNKNKTK